MMAAKTFTSINFNGHRLHLLAERAIHWPAQKALIVADVHLGKATAFRKFGLPVPSGGSSKDLEKLSALLATTESTRLIILGDLIHARASRQPQLEELLTTWRRKHRKLDVLLVRGNHDRRAGKVLPDWKIEEVEEPFQFDGVYLCHDPQCELSPRLAGHVHPVFGLRDFDGSNIAVACFVVTKDYLTLPAFGHFTGGWRVDPRANQEIFIATGKTVVKVPRKDREA